MRQNEIEEIIGLINKGFELEELAFELDIPMEDLLKYKKQLDIRKSVKELVQNGDFQLAIEKLSNYISNSENNIVERYMLIKLNAYVARSNVNEELLQKIQEEKKVIGFSKDIEKVLEELEIQIPKRKTSNIRRKEKGKDKKQEIKQENKDEIFEDVKDIELHDYEKTIETYKKEIESDKKNALNKRNLIAFTYYKAGMIEESRKELMTLIEQFNSYTAYRQMIHLEKVEGNLEDAKIWAYEGIENYPNSINFREELISIAKEENDSQEIIKQLKEITKIDIASKKNKKRYETIRQLEER